MMTTTQDFFSNPYSLFRGPPTTMRPRESPINNFALDFHKTTHNQNMDREERPPAPPPPLPPPLTPPSKKYKRKPLSEHIFNQPNFYNQQTISFSENGI
uniref:Uncharacterized protein n=1 Tax=Glossina morsitans morsitans TaxID=37546 RepID=A0A1B0FP25_GLOMM